VEELSSPAIDRSVIRAIEDIDQNQIDQIKKLENEMFGRGGLNEWHIPFLVRNGKVYIVELDSHIIGVAELMRNWDVPDDIYLIGLSIDKSFHRKKLGRKFLQTIIDDSSGENCNKILLTVSKDNNAALSLYCSCGFTTIDELSDEYGVGVDRLLMKKDLNNDS